MRHHILFEVQSVMPIQRRDLPMGARLTMLSVRAGIFSSLVIPLTMAGCITLPPMTSLNPPTNSLGPVE
jgi:hypothetical protein